MADTHTIPRDRLSTPLACGLAPPGPPFRMGLGRGRHPARAPRTIKLGLGLAAATRLRPGPGLGPSLDGSQIHRPRQGMETGALAGPRRRSRGAPLAPDLRTGSTGPLPDPGHTAGMVRTPASWVGILDLGSSFRMDGFCLQGGISSRPRGAVGAPGIHPAPRLQGPPVRRTRRRMPTLPFAQAVQGGRASRKGSIALTAGTAGHQLSEGGRRPVETRLTASRWSSLSRPAEPSEPIHQVSTGSTSCGRDSPQDGQPGRPLRPTRPTWKSVD